MSLPRNWVAPHSPPDRISARGRAHIFTFHRVCNQSPPIHRAGNTLRVCTASLYECHELCADAWYCHSACSREPQALSILPQTPILP